MTADLTDMTATSPPPTPSSTTQTLSQPVKALAVRLWGLDLIRALAIMDIVGVHAGAWHWNQAADQAVVIKSHPLGGLGLPVFLLCSIGLAARRYPPRLWKVQSKQRMKRLLRPYAIAWVAYLLINTIYEHVFGLWTLGNLGRFEWWNLVVGTEYLLWYLPFILVAECVAHGIVCLWPNGPGVKAMGLYVAMLGLGVAGLLLSPSHQVWFEGQWPVPETKLLAYSWMRAWVCVPFGIAFGLALRAEHEQKQVEPETDDQFTTPSLGLFFNRRKMLLLGLCGVGLMFGCREIQQQGSWGFIQGPWVKWVSEWANLGWAQRFGFGLFAVVVASWMSAWVSCFAVKWRRRKSDSAKESQGILKQVIDWGNRGFHRWVGLTFGIYLVHGALIFPVKSILTQLGFVPDANAPELQRIWLWVYIVSALVTLSWQWVTHKKRHLKHQ